MKKLPDNMQGKIVELRNGGRYVWDYKGGAMIHLDSKYGFMFISPYDAFGRCNDKPTRFPYDLEWDIVKVYDSNFKKIWTQKEKVHNFENWEDLIGCTLTFRNGETAEVFSNGHWRTDSKWSIEELSEHYKFSNLKRKKSQMYILCTEKPRNFDIIKIEKNKVLYERKDK